MATYTAETTHAGEFLVSEGNGAISRESITVLSGEDLAAGTVLGVVTNGTASAAAGTGDTGDGTMGTITVGAGAKAGNYVLTIIEPASDAGAFTVEDPDGINVGTGTVAVAFSGGGIGFTLADGANDFISGDTFVITVAAGSLKYVQFDEDGADGSENAAGILIDAVDASAADAAGVAIVRMAEVNGGEIIWPSTIEAGEITAAIVELNALNIIVRGA